MKFEKTLLIFRFSAFGDVAMTVPVLREFLAQHPEVRVIYVSRKKFQDLLEDLPNCQFYAADLDGKHKGILGLFRLAKALKQFHADGIADLHNVLRTKILRFFLFNHKSAVLDKGRNERKALIRSENKIRKPIKPMVERYADVFRNLGFELNLSHQLRQNTTQKEHAVGIAPFAMYEGKMFPLDKMKEVVCSLAENGLKVYLFGGKNEQALLTSWEEMHENIVSVAGKFDLKTELNLIRRLKLMVSMDSANMHLASLVGTRTISIWGNTHPFTGFLGYGQSMDDVVQDERLLIRPTSVFGKEPKNGEKIDYFEQITSEMLLQKIYSAID